MFNITTTTTTTTTTIIVITIITIGAIAISSSIITVSLIVYSNDDDRINSELTKIKNEMNDKLNENDGRLDNVESTVSSMKEELSRVNERHDDTVRSLEELRDRYNMLEKKVRAIEKALESEGKKVIEDKGDFILSFYFDTDDLDQGGLAVKKIDDVSSSSSMIRKYRIILQPIIEELNSRFKLPYDIHVIVADCGLVPYSAYTKYEVYTRKVQEIVICIDRLERTLELVNMKLSSSGSSSSGSSSSNAGDSNNDNMFRFIVKATMYHEVGHAMIVITDILDGSRRESLADDFMFYMLILDNDNNITDVEQLLIYYSGLVKLEEELTGAIYMVYISGTHLTYKQKYYDFSCLASGAGISSQNISQHMNLGIRSRELCFNMWYELSRGWYKVLYPYMQ